MFEMASVRCGNETSPGIHRDSPAGQRLHRIFLRLKNNGLQEKSVPLLSHKYRGYRGVQEESRVNKFCNDELARSSCLRARIFQRSLKGIIPV